MYIDGPWMGLMPKDEEGKRLLLAARAHRQNVLAPPSTIVSTSRSTNPFDKK
jgi:hypothetical protein